MQTHDKSATGAQLLVRTLARYGVSHVSCVAGESYLAVLDALLDHPEIKVVTCRQEGGAAFMAESWGKLTGAPGVCFVTRGPGACNASIGVHTATQDSTPMILFMGQVARADRGREAFQEIDVRAVFGGLAKAVMEIDDAARVPEMVGRALATAASGRPGPVVISLPEDMLVDTANVAVPDPIAPQPVDVGKASLQEFTALLREARQPVVLLGGSGWTDQGCADIARFCNVAHLPVCAAFRRHDLFDHRDNNYVGELGTGPNPRLLERLREADMLIAVGARLDEITTQGYTLPAPGAAGPKLIHIHQSAAEIGKVYAPALGIVADVNKAAAMLAEAARHFDGRLWAGWKEELRRLYEDWTAIDDAAKPAWNGADMTLIFSFLREALPRDAIITTDAGNFSGWAQRYLRYGRPGRLLAPVSGAMGYGVPAAIAASLAAGPERLVVGLCGDGGFMMTGQELATIAHHRATPLIIVCNNGQYGTIKMHQERHYPGRASATALTNPDFVKLAESYGLPTARVTRAADFPALWEKFGRPGRAGLIEIVMDPAQLTTNSKK